MFTQITRIRRYALISAVVWTVCILCAYGWFYYQQRSNILEIAKAEARIAFQKDTLYRKWATGHGGVYVPVDERTPPNPHLSHISERDLITVSGRSLTLMNPAYMMRQVFELTDKEKVSVRGHITSLKPIRRENAPDPWEARALRVLEGGEQEVSQLVTINGQRAIRLMRPFVTEKGCLKCHASQGYRVGDLRGGISVTVPLAALSGYQNKLVAGTAAAHGAIWLLGIGMIGVGRRALSKSALELELGEERYRTVAEYTADWEYWLAPDESFRYVSPSCDTISGYTQDEFYHDPGLLRRIIHPDDSDLYLGHAHASCVNGTPKPVDFRIITRDGQTRWVSHVCRTVFSSDGKDIGRRASNRDITDRKRSEEMLHEQAVLLEQEIAERQVAQEALQEQTIVLEEEISERIQAEETLRLSEEKFARSFENAPLIITISAMEDGTLLDVNRKFIELTGFSREEAIGKTTIELGWLKAEDRHIIIDKFRHEGRISGVEVNTHTKDGRIITSMYYGEIILVADERRILSILLDMTEQRNLEEQLRQSQKMEAIGQLAGGVAHDFNNFLQVILGYGNMLNMDANLNERQKEMLEQIVKASERAAQLTHGLLAFSRKQVMTPRKANLNDIVRSVQKLLARVIGEDIQLMAILHQTPLDVFVDIGQVEQVLINLATNARDAMPKGGTLTVETTLIKIDDSFVAVHGYGEPGPYALMSLSDTGMGMDEVTRKRLFEPFFTTKGPDKGTGLGMAIVYGIVKQHNGFINVYSEPGMGTTFRVYFPVIGRGQAASEEPAPYQPPEGGTETILVAEDEGAVRDLMVSLLKDFGYDVILAVDGQDAVEKFKVSADKVKLVIMDMIMPRKSGREACEEIRRMQTGVRILYASGYPLDGIKNRGELDEQEELVMKPVQPTELLRKVREMLDRK